MPHIESRPDAPYVTIPIEVTYREWGRALALFAELFRWLRFKHIEAAGPPFLRYWVIGGAEKKYALEAGVPVKRPVEGDGRIFADIIPAGRYATLVHRGHPDRLAESHAALREWAEEEGVALDRMEGGSHEVWGGLYEFYLIDPTSEPNPDRWSTQIAYRVLEK